MSDQQPEIKISAEYEKLVPRMPEKEYEALKEDIKLNGQDRPVVVNQNGVVLDGHHRFRACQELGIPIKTEKKEFENKIDEEIYVLGSGLLRRHLDEGQRSFVALTKKDKLAEKAKQNQRLSQGQGIKVSNKLETLSTDKQLAAEANVSNATIYNADQIKKAKEETPNRPVFFDDKYHTCQELYEFVWTAEQPVTAVAGAIKKDQKTIEEKEQETKHAKELELPEGVKLYNMKIEDVTNKQVQDNSVKLILTDPPYAQEYLYLYDELADFASKKLVDGGSLVFFFGSSFLPTVLEYFKKYDNLTYWWIFGVKHEGPGAQIFYQNVISDWKPMLWFIKGKQRASNKVIHDFIKSELPDKDKHEWAQSEVEAKFIIENLTAGKDALVCDPFLGAGTFGSAAVKLDRRFIGIEKEKETFDKASRNLECMITT